MVIAEPKTLYDTVKPLIYFNCFIGMGFIRQPNQSRAAYFMMKIHTAFFTIVNLVMIYITFDSLPKILDFDYASPLAILMYKTLVSVNSSITVLAPILVWIRRKALIDCAQHMLILDDTFANVLGAKNHYRSRYIRVICQIIAIFLVMCLVGICDTVASLKIVIRMDIRSLLTFASVAHTLHHPILVMLVLDVNFCFFVRYLGKKFQDMNDSLLKLTEHTSTDFFAERLFIVSKNVIKTRPRSKTKNTEFEGLRINDKHNSLRAIRKAHLELCKLSRKINLVFGIQNLLSMAISFVMITGLSYTIYSAFEWQNFNKNRLKEVIPTVVWTAIYSFKVWMVNHSCWSVSNEAERTGEVIYELLNLKVDKQIQREIQEFGVQMLQNPVNFNACGFFTLDYAFVQGVIGSITTYLVILIQMSHISESPASDTNLSLNGTEIPS